MQTLSQGYKGMRVLMTLNIDRVLYTGALIAALYAGSYIALM